VPDRGQAVSGYIRPSPRDPTETWLELALPRGRWAILYDAALCTPPTVWRNVWLAVDDQSNRPITVDGDDGATCAVAQWSWTSDVPCAADDQGTCDVALDGAYWDAIAQVEAAGTDTQAEAAATDTPVPIPVATPAPRAAPTPPPRAAAVAPPATPAPRIEVVVQTVVVVVTRIAEPTSTPEPSPTATLAPSPTDTATIEPTSTDVPPPVVVEVTGTPVPPAAVAHTNEPAAAPSEWNWTLTFGVLGLVLGLLAIWLFVARSGPVMW
jgi:hypothetical protein